MEKDRFFVRKKDIVLGTVMAAAFSAGFQSAHAKDPYKPENYPDSIFQPVIIYDKEREETSSNKSYSNVKVELPSLLSDREQKELKIQKEKQSVISNMQANPELFSDKYVQDVEIYYPIYKSVADKYGLDWYLLWIVHENETGASAGTKGFTKESYYKGAMQRDPNVWSRDFVEQASEGLENLASLFQRQKDDWKEIAAGASILNRNIDHYKDLGNDEAVLNALLLYSSDDEARQRFEQYKTYEQVFEKNSRVSPLKPG